MAFLGPFPLSSAAIDKHVSSKLGYYVLGDVARDGKLNVMRVGRSDSNVNARLKNYLGDDSYADCTHFMFEIVGTAREGFDAESELYHRFKPMLNKNHPGRPRGTSYCCVVDDKHHCAPCSEED